MPNITGYQSLTTVEGDTFDALALEFYNDEKLSHYIIQANPDYCDVLIFGAGTELKIPIVENPQTPQSLPPWRRGE